MPTMQRLADNGLTYTPVAHDRALLADALVLPDRPQPPPERLRPDRRGRARASRATPGTSRWRTRPSAEVLREKGWNTFWVGKNHNVPARRVGDGRHQAATGRSPAASTASTASSAARPTTGIPTWSRTTTTSTSRTSPRRATTSRRTWPTRRLRFIRDSKQSRADEALVPVVLPGRQPRAAPRPAGVHRQVQGQVRRRLRGLPRVGPAADDRARDPARGHRAHADQPAARGRSVADATWCARGTRSPTTRSGCSPAWPRSTPASRSTPTPRSAGSSTTSRSRASSTTRSSSTAPTTAPRARAPRTARSTRTSSSTPGPTTSQQNLAMLDELGCPDTYNHYPTGWAMAFSTPFRMFKRYTYQGGVCDPLVIHWPKGIEARGEVRNQYHHAIDIVPTILECCGLEFPDTCRATSRPPLPGVSMRYSLRRADAPTAKEVQYYAMFGHARRSGTTAGRPSPSAARSRAACGRLRQRHAGSSSTPTRTARRRTTSPAEHPEKVQQLVDLWYVEAGKYDVLPLDDRHARGPRRGRARRRDPARRRLQLLPGHARRCRSSPPPNAAAARTRSSPRSRSPTPAPRA